MRRRLGFLVIGALAACHHGASPTTPKVRDGMIAGVIRSATTGAAIGDAIVVIRKPGQAAPLQHLSDVNGTYMIPELPPGSYQVTAYVASTQIGERTADVRSGEVAGVDFTIGAMRAPAEADANGAPALWRFHPAGADQAAGVIEGTVSDQHMSRVANAVVSVSPSGKLDARLTASDDEGRFRVDALAPGSYDVSAYYSVVQRGQIEVRRSRVEVAGGETVFVPLALDTAAR